MLDKIFLQVINMSFTSSFVIIFVLILRLILKKAPKIFSYALWSVVLFRLICPISFESLFSILPVNTAIISTDTLYSETPQISTGLTYLDNISNQILPVPYIGASVNPLQVWTFIGEAVWILGIIILACYSVISLLRLRYKLIGSVRLRDNIFLADHIVTPFVIGIIHPKIYLPSTLSKQEENYIILHEQTHIKRFDYLVKIVAFVVLCVHWFNPFVWAAFIFTVKDMEMSCDESVIKQLGTDICGEYSASLLRLATGRKIIAGTPLTFGEGDTKGRIKNVMKYKKPAFGVTIAALIIVFTFCSALALNPKHISKQWAENLRVNDVEKIELVVMPSNENEEYRLFDRSEFPAIVSLINESRGRYLSNHELISGKKVTYYITTNDGVRHEFSNIGNTYLIIDGDFYDAGYNWLSSWGNKKGNTMMPHTFWAAPNWNNLRDKRKEYSFIFQEYIQYGLEYRISSNRLYFNGDLVRYFEDIESENYYKRWPMTDGDIDVYAVRNSSGKLVGIEPFTKDQFEKRTPTLNDEIHELSITNSISNYYVDDEEIDMTDDEKVYYTEEMEQRTRELIEKYYTLYNSYGLAYEKVSNRLYYNGNLVNYFEDKEAGRFFGPYDDSNLNIYAIRDDSGNLFGLSANEN